MATRQELHRLLERAQTHNACEVLYRHRDMFEIGVACDLGGGAASGGCEGPERCDWGSRHDIVSRLCP